MDYIKDWTNLNNISMTGWDGSKAFSNGKLILTATNGWRTFGWTPNAVGKNVNFEFDYFLADTTNLSGTGIFIVNLDSINYGSSIQNLSTTQGIWYHCCCNIPLAKTVIGINIRGIDNTGKNVVMYIANLRIYDDISSPLSITETGILNTGIFNETYLKKASFAQESVLSNNFYEY